MPTIKEAICSHCGRPINKELYGFEVRDKKIIYCGDCCMYLMEKGRMPK